MFLSTDTEVAGGVCIRTDPIPGPRLQCGSAQSLRSPASSTQDIQGHSAGGRGRRQDLPS